MLGAAVLSLSPLTLAPSVAALGPLQIQTEEGSRSRTGLPPLTAAETDAPVASSQLSADSLAQMIAKEHGISEREARVEVERVSLALQQALSRGDEVWLFGLGRFEQHDRRIRCRRKSAAGAGKECKEGKTRRVVRFVVTSDLRKRIEEAQGPDRFGNN